MEQINRELRIKSYSLAIRGLTRELEELEAKRPQAEAEVRELADAIARKQRLMSARESALLGLDHAHRNLLEDKRQMEEALAAATDPNPTDPWTAEMEHMIATAPTLEPLAVPHSENYRTPDGYEHPPCIVCGRECHHPAHEVWMDLESGKIVDPATEEGDLSCEAIGTTCLKNHPELRPYLIR